MTVSVPTWVVMLPLLVVYMAAWIYFGGKAWDRWVTPPLTELLIRRVARKYGMTVADARALWDRTDTGRRT